MKQYYESYILYKEKMSHLGHIMEQEGYDMRQIVFAEKKTNDAEEWIGRSRGLETSKNAPTKTRRVYC